MACQECGMATRDPGEFHPYAFCVWVKAGLEPWETLEDGCQGIELKPRRDREHFDVDATYSQGPYRLDKFERIQEIADEFGLDAHFSLNGGMRVWFR